MPHISSDSIETLYAGLNSSASGLSDETARQRIIALRNSQKKESRFFRELKLLLRQFTNPLVLLLIIAVILSASLGESSDTIIILFILLSTGFMSFFQELKASRAVEKLQQIIKLKCQVRRNNKETEVNAEDVVAGDIILFKAGDIIPEDCRIISANELHVNESALTGESYPVEKMAGTVDENLTISGKYNCLWKGTSVVSGSAEALVVFTGNDSVFGKIQKSLQGQTETAFEKGIKGFGFFILQITIVLSILILGVNLYFKKPLFDSILFSLAIAVGMAPELLPAIMTFAMSAGARRMMVKKVIVKKLSSIFNFGEVNILCTDKTGTITEGVIQVKQMLDPLGHENKPLQQLAYLNAAFQNGFNNPIDEAILSLKLDTTGYEKLNEIPYDFIRKRLSVLVAGHGQNTIITKGAVPNILGICSQYEANGEVKEIDATVRQDLEQRFQAFGAEGYRVIGVCRKAHATPKIQKEDETAMVFMGFILLIDPLKESSVEAIEKLKSLSVATKIITGDNRYIAQYTAKQLGIESPKIITGTELNNMSPEALAVQVLDTNLFAEIEPHQKERIIRALQKAGKTVAYMGDGINDVAAIHAADTGISVNDAVDVAKDVADFVLLEKSLLVLADGIVEGRKSFANSMKYILINTGATFGNMFSVAGASLMLPFLPMLPKQILLTNFLTDFPYLSVASDNVDDEVLEKPGQWNMKTIRRFMIVFGIHSSLFDFATFYVMYYYFRLKDSQFQTGWFLESVLTELLILFVIRTRKSFLKSVPGRSLLITSAIAGLITVLLPVSPFAGLLNISIAHVQQVLAIALILLLYVASADLLKVLFFRWQARKHPLE
ncbi:MAG: magnesium-translocating P-type ATPase [Bacteroidetes bacterium]|nr:magnesium-translocating P-type ATPase [Bacteroidota bacterium]